ncbi:MAG: YebC/PmpR family DNA-binding transcriptional regulator [Clostridia bacterium]|nr:YebC/PmpR family DNA-binding transcriptional regulator [Clostridia bacterium]
MSGHSKWHNIQAKKSKTDAARAKVFTKIGKEIAIAIREGGPNPNSNSKLRELIVKAKANNVPNDNIDRIIKKATEEKKDYKEITYEGYGPGGVAVIVETATDNTNRTVGNVRAYFSKFHGNMGNTGCVSFMFTEKGVITIEKEDCELSEDELMELAIESGADDFSAEEEDVYEITTEPADLPGVRDALMAKNIKLAGADLEKIPGNYVTLSNEDDVKWMTLLLDKLEEDDDVQQVYHNWEG